MADVHGAQRVTDALCTNYGFVRAQIQDGRSCYVKKSYTFDVIINQNLPSTNKSQRQTSLNGITDSSLSSGFASDLSSAAAPSTRFPSFSLASMESLEAADSTWFSSFDPNAAPSTTTSSVTAESSKRANKNGESNSSGQKKNRHTLIRLYMNDTGDKEKTEQSCVGFLGVESVIE
ncbi:hypothetical protein ACTXT7_009165 [Hymenolepis weldensis]